MMTVQACGVRVSLPHAELVALHSTTSTMTLPSIRPTKRRKRSTALVEGDVDAANAVTHETVTKPKKSGGMKTQTRLIPLVPVIKEEQNTNKESIHEDDTFIIEDCDHADAGPDANGNSTGKVKLFGSIQRFIF